MNPLERWMMVLGLVALTYWYQAGQGVGEVDAAEHGEKIGYLPVGSSPEALAQREIALAPPAASYSVETLKKHLSAKNYLAADTLFQEMESVLARDIQFELHYASFLWDISAGMGFRLSHLDAWVEESGSAFAHLARAQYLKNAAWAARGEKTAAEAGRSRTDSFRELQQLAVADALAALGTRPQLAMAFPLLAQSIHARALPFSKEELVSWAESVAPWSFTFRWSYLYAVSPRWGGSYAEMEEFIERTRPFMSTNPRLWTLQGRISGDRGSRAYRNGDYEGCVRHYSQALQFGVQTGWLGERAECLSRLGGLEELALEDVELSLQIVEEPKYRRLADELRAKIASRG